MNKVHEIASALLCAVIVASTSAFAVSSSSASPPNGVRSAVVEESIVRPTVLEGRDLRFTHLSRLQGLSQTRVAQMVQDDDGFVWFGTQQGLNRYDGYRFKVYTHEPDKQGSLIGVFIYALFKDRAGVIWVGTDEALNRFDRATESFTNFRVGPKNPFVIDISQDATGMLWLSTDDGLYRFDPASADIARFAHDPLRPDSLPSDDVKSSGMDRSGNLWVASSLGLSQFDPERNKVRFHVPMTESVREFSFLEDRTGTFWIAGGSGSGLAILDRSTGVLQRYSFNDPSNGDSGPTGVYALLEDRDGNVWLATMGAGLVKFDQTRKEFVRYRHRFGDPESLEENRVISLMQDREGNIWAGLHAMAPNVFSPHPPPFASIQPAQAIKDGSGENLVNAIFQDRRGDLWLGTGGALNRLDRTTGRYTSFRPKGSNADFEVLSIVEDGDGILWIGTLGQGVNSFDPRTERFGPAHRHDPGNPKGSLSHNIVPRVLLDSKGTLWATTWNGLNRVDRRTGNVDVFKRDPNSTVEVYFELAEDPSGDLWVGSATGLYRFRPTDGTFLGYRHDPKVPSSLSNNTLSSVFVDSKGNLWVGTLNGLNRFNRETLDFKAYYKKDGLPGNAASCILEDGESRLWISTNNGVARLDLRDERLLSFSMADGLPGADLTGWAACSRGPSGEMFFGGFSGATAFRPDLVSDSTYVPPIALTNFAIGGKSVLPGFDSVLQKSISATNQVVLRDDQNNFQIEFAALSYASPMTSRYRYMLEGLDQTWHEVTAEQRTVGFTTLPAGDYVFKVQGATTRGPWTEPGVALRIVVLPPWWGTLWFRVLSALVLVGALVLAYLYRLRQIGRMFEARVEERNRIARELHDTLLQGFHGLLYCLQGVRNFLPGSPDAAIQSLDTALDRGELVIKEARDAVQQLRSSADREIDLAQTLRGLGEELSLDRGEQPVFRVVADGPTRPLDAQLCDEIYRIAREAVLNAHRYARAKSITVEISHGRLFALRVRDDGVGMESGAVDRAVSQGHWGLQGMRERAHYLGGQLKVTSQPNSGTEVELLIPGQLVYR